MQFCVRKYGYTLMYSIGSGCFLFEIGRETRPRCCRRRRALPCSYETLSFKHFETFQRVTVMLV